MPKNLLAFLYYKVAIFPKKKNFNLGILQYILDKYPGCNLQHNGVMVYDFVARNIGITLLLHEGRDNFHVKSLQTMYVPIKLCSVHNNFHFHHHERVLHDDLQSLILKLLLCPSREKDQVVQILLCLGLFKWQKMGGKFSAGTILETFFDLLLHLLCVSGFK